MDMGANAKEFLMVRMTHEKFQEIPPEVKEGMELNYVDVEGYDYSHDDLWCDLKKKSKKAYVELKKREYDLRHNVKSS